MLSESIEKIGCANLPGVYENLMVDVRKIVSSTINKVIFSDSENFLRKIFCILLDNMPEVPNELKYRILKSRVKFLIDGMKALKKELDEMKDKLDANLKTYNNSKPSPSTFFPTLNEAKALYKKAVNACNNYNTQQTSLSEEVQKRIDEDPKNTTSKESAQLIMEAHDDLDDLLDGLTKLGKRTTRFEGYKKEIGQVYYELNNSLNVSFEKSYNALKDRIINKESKDYTEYSLEVGFDKKDENQQTIITFDDFDEDQIKYLKNIFYLFATKAEILKKKNDYIYIEINCENSKLLKPLFDLAVNWKPCFNIQKLANEKEWKKKITKFNQDAENNVTKFDGLTETRKVELNKMVDKKWLSQRQEGFLEITDDRKNDLNEYKNKSNDILSLDERLSGLENYIEERSKKINKTVTDNTLKKVSMIRDILVESNDYPKKNNLKDNILEHNKKTKMFYELQWKKCTIVNPSESNESTIKHPSVTSQESKKSVENFTYYFDLFGCLYENGWIWTYLNEGYFVKYRNSYNFIKMNPDEYKSFPQKAVEQKEEEGDSK
jgi:hypothetical protein